MTGPSRYAIVAPMSNGAAASLDLRRLPACGLGAGPDDADAPDVSVVVPCRGCAATLPALVEGVAAALGHRGPRVEFVLVADNSADDVSAIATLMAGRDDVRGLRVAPADPAAPARGVGQHVAIALGLAQTTGRVVIVMDGDLQHRPQDVPRLLAALDDVGVDVVVARRVARSEGLLVRTGSRLFFRLLSVVVGASLDPGLSSFSAMRRRVVDELPRPRGGPRHHLLELWRAGARWTSLPVEFPPRAAGRSQYALASRVRLARDLLLVARPGVRALGVTMVAASCAGSIVAASGEGTPSVFPLGVAAAVALAGAAVMGHAGPRTAPATVSIGPAPPARR